ncbi:MAG: hypothetical protein Q9217_001403 [Psora testacea]
MGQFGLPCLVILTYIFLFYPLAANAQTLLPAQNLTNITTDLNHHSTLLRNPLTYDPEIRCTPGAATQRPNREDCVTALLHMPQDTLTSTFRSGNDPDDPYQLPKQFFGGRCMTTVSLRQDVREEHGSWIAINLAATQLILVCDAVSRGSMLVRTGGSVRTGREGMISILVSRVMRSGDGDEDEDKDKVAEA